MSYQGVQLRITGKVQGVGFRPFVWQLAEKLGLSGTVKNDSAGVEVCLLEPVDVDLFTKHLCEDLPPLARIDEIIQKPFNWDQKPTGFKIEVSQSGSMATQVTPDAATCPACLAEMNDPKDRRYRYPFINCTHCGPRFTIIRSMPYDRAATSMASFKLCDACSEEYNSPKDRRFHAQPVACPDCGPQLISCLRDNKAQHHKEDALQDAVSALKDGKIVAIKGLGGFHLACDATNTEAVERLRKCKHRPSKPFAVMLPNNNWISRCATNTDLKRLETLLNSPMSPIVLVEQKASSPLSDAIAPGLDEVGLMLPSNPLQHLLLQDVDCPLVMTSGNLNGRAPSLTNEQALSDLADIADLWLMHDRDILHRADDSLVRLLPDEFEMFRRARGFAPDALPLPKGFSTNQILMATGGDLKNSFCLLNEDKGLLGPHLGDLKQEDVQQQWKEAMPHFSALYHAKPTHIATDMHPGYISHQWSKAQSLPVIEVLHHHAHIASCMGENAWPLDGGKVIGLALDGLGYGEDGKIWGGECLLVDYTSCKHLGGLPAVALPGGDLAAKQPWRNQLAHFARFVPNWQDYPEAKILLEKQWEPLLKAIEGGINAPLSSSTGRLFDAVSAALGYAPEAISWEGEAATHLEAKARLAKSLKHSVTMPLLDNQLDLATFWKQWLSWEGTKEEKAWIFHDVLAEGFANLAKHCAEQYKINTVALSGGVLHNRLLRERLEHHLSPLKVLRHHLLPSGDGGISFGQALVASAQLSKNRC